MRLDPERPLRTADVVLHRPTGETWVLAYADHDAGKLCPMGWPFCEAAIADCDPVKLAEDDAYLDTLADLAVSGAQCAQKATRLAAIEIGGRL